MSSISVPGTLRIRKKCELQIKIKIPDFSSIKLRGQIVGYIKNPLGKVAKTIIQILPYGHQKQYNSFETKEKLEQCLNSRISAPNNQNKTDQ